MSIHPKDEGQFQKSSVISHNIATELDEVLYAGGIAILRLLLEQADRDLTLNADDRHAAAIQKSIRWKLQYARGSATPMPHSTRSLLSCRVTLWP